MINVRFLIQGSSPRYPYSPPALHIRLINPLQDHSKLLFLVNDDTEPDPNLFNTYCHSCMGMHFFLHYKPKNLNRYNPNPTESKPLTSTYEPKFKSIFKYVVNFKLRINLLKHIKFIK